MKKTVYLKLEQLACGEGVGIAANMLVAVEIVCIDDATMVVMLKQKRENKRDIEALVYSTR